MGYFGYKTTNPIYGLFLGESLTLSELSTLSNFCEEMCQYLDTAGFAKGFMVWHVIAHGVNKFYSQVLMRENGEIVIPIARHHQLFRHESG